MGALFGSFQRAAPAFAVAWWALLVVGAVLPSVFAVLMGRVVGLVGHPGEEHLTPWLLALGGCFLVMQVLPHLHTVVSRILGLRVANWLTDRLMHASVQPAGIAHLEDPELAIGDPERGGGGGPPLFLAVDFLRGSLRQLFIGVTSGVVLVFYSWWAAAVLMVVWGSTHWMLRESSVWKDRNTDGVRLTQQHADYAYELAMDPRPAKEIRLFGLGGWVVDRFANRRREMYDAQYHATRLRERPVLAAAALVITGNVVVFGLMGYQASVGAWTLPHLVTSVQLALGVQWIAFGGLTWAIDDATAAVAMVNRLEPKLRAVGHLPSGATSVRDGPVQIELRDVRFGYSGTEPPVLSDLTLMVRAGESLAVVGANGAGKTSLAKLLCRFYDPDDGVVLVDGVDLRELDLGMWRGRCAAVFQDFARFERSLRDNVDPRGRCNDAVVRAALRDAGARSLTDADLETPMAKGYPGGLDLSGGQWQRVALARVICAVRSGAGLVLLDEPTANLDVRGELTMFAQLLAETRGVTTVLVSHRFSTVRMADRIAVLADGRVAEVGTHDELMAADGHYRRMFDLQASRFTAEYSEEGEPYDTLA